jgi:hypothetical protein
MIRFSLKCLKGHAFDSWFQSGAAYDGLRKAGHVACPVCGATNVEKSLMTPMVSPIRAATGGMQSPPNDHPEVGRAKALAKLKAEIEANSDYVGTNFAAEARKMHLGDMPERAIYGEAKPEEARALIEEGVPVAPLPFMPRRKVN